MANLSRFKMRLAKLPARIALFPGFMVLRVDDRHFILYSGMRTFEVTPPFPVPSLSDILSEMKGAVDIESILAALPALQSVLVLDVLERLHDAGVVISSDDFALLDSDPRYLYNTLLFGHIRQFARVSSPGAVDASLHWQRNLRKATVGIIGAGQAGSQIARLLAIAGIGSLRMVDDAIVDEAILATDAWYSRSDLGCSRVDALGSHVAETNPSVAFEPIQRPLKGLRWLPPEILDSDFIVVAADHGQPDLNNLTNQGCVEARVPWCSYRSLVAGTIIEIGPLVYPGETACFACYQRGDGNLSDTTFTSNLSKEHREPWSLVVQPDWISLGVDILVQDVVRFLSRVVDPVTFNKVVSFYVPRGETSIRPILRIPTCTCCGRVGREYSRSRFWAKLQMAGSEH